MTRLRYANGEKYCKVGEHFITAKETVLSKTGQKLCKEHRFLVRSRPRGKKWREALLKARAQK